MFILNYLKYSYINYISHALALLTQGNGRGPEGGGARGGSQRLWWGPHPGGSGVPRWLRGHLPQERPELGGRASGRWHVQALVATLPRQYACASWLDCLLC